MAVGEYLQFCAGVEPEHLHFRLGGYLAPQLDGVVAVGSCGRILAHLYDRTATVPPVGWCESVPKRVVNRQGCVVQGGMFGAYFLVCRCAVLQIVSVAVGLEIAPLGRHLRRGNGMVVLCIQVVAVIFFVDFNDVLVKLLKQF